MSEDGYLVGIVGRDQTAEYNTGCLQGVSPHYAAVPAEVVVRAVSELELNVCIPFVGLE